MWHIAMAAVGAIHRIKNQQTSFLASFLKGPLCNAVTLDSVLSTVPP
jgi:hypothetical protein